MSKSQEQLQILKKAVLSDAWPYWLGGIFLAVLNITHFAVFGAPWGVTTPFAYWGAWIIKAFGAHPEKWAFFNNPAGLKTLAGGLLKDGGSLQNIGIIVGALFAALLASQFRVKKIKSYKQIIGAAAGGLLMGYGARIAYGCNIGAFFSGTASLSLHGWVYTVFILVGAYIGSKILVKYLI